MADESSSNSLHNGVYHIGFSFPDDVTGIDGADVDNGYRQSIISCIDDDTLSICLNHTVVEIPDPELLRFISFPSPTT